MTPEQEAWLQRPTLLPPALRQIEGTTYWLLDEEYRVSLPPPHYPLRLVLPLGWRYDRSSIPTIVPTWLISRDSLGCLAPGAHDAGYRCRGHFRPAAVERLGAHIVDEAGTPVELRVTRAEVDEWFRLYLLRQRIVSWRATAAYYAVRAWWGAREALGLSRRW